MKINIKHISNTFNYGSCMMAITLISKINENVENVDFYVDAASDIDLEILKMETNINNILRDNVERSDNFIKKCINKLKRIKLNKIVEKINTVIVIGGDDISEYYGIEYLEKELYRLREESKSKNIILLGQTMGPFTGNRGRLAMESLKNTKIYTRDNKSLDYLLGLSFKNVRAGRDLAFYKLPMQFMAKSILNKYNINKEEYITIVPSGLTKCYTKNFEKYIVEQVNITKKILDNHKLSDKKIVFLPHVLIPEHVDDRLIIREIVNRLDEKSKMRIIPIDDAMLPSEAREILGNGIFTITGRMHAAVSTFYMRKPAISLSYSVKYAGVIGEGLDMNELVIESADEKLWNSGDISKLADEKVNFVLDNYDEIVKKIDIKVSETIKIVEEELEDVVCKISKK
ncbi:polysaccharide pyruvyl transferase family protein [Clostridium sp.]|uniref:polysaccharide pyruvyl transferase family protein n=1 Tax=Clostridium sp. TaxID=1506 RepID=UPI0028424703|nr:polysaccharide pyruvyl transferase family protein [Clostridium sp.]MDR3598470.1 polysaccharide pyruvyl transferase family protein [Clostridium sp.]